MAAGSQRMTRVIRLSGGKEPEGAQTCKFVLVAEPVGLALVFGPVSRFPYHANLVAEFCDTEEIASGWVRKPDVVEVYDPSYTVTGGGWLKIDNESRCIQVYGYSTAYGTYRRQDVRSALKTVAEFREYSVQCE